MHRDLWVGGGKAFLFGKCNCIYMQTKTINTGDSKQIKREDTALPFGQNIGDFLGLRTETKQEHR